MSYQEICSMNYGADRRKLILLVIQSRKSQGWTGLPVNNKHQIQIKNDPDLKYLLKRKKVKIKRIRQTFFSFHSQTYLV